MVGEEDQATLRAGHQAGVFAATVCSVPVCTLVLRKMHGVAALLHFGAEDTPRLVRSTGPPERL